MNDDRPCGCGSGLPSRWAFDARGIELGRVCRRFETEVLARSEWFLLDARGRNVNGGGDQGEEHANG